jgi:hypothetical protein
MATFSLSLGSNSQNTARFSRTVTIGGVDGVVYDSTLLAQESFIPVPACDEANPSLDFTCVFNSQYLPAI